MPWDIQHRRGLWLPQTGWWLDAQGAVSRSFVSHAHSDHIAAHREIICTAATARLVRERLPGSRTEHVLPFGHAERLSAEAAITLYPAGHVLGSAQCLLTHERLGTLLYTGDFQLRPSIAAESCATPRADVLIMETTFGLPRYVFPPASEVFAALGEFCRSALDDGLIEFVHRVQPRLVYTVHGFAREFAGALRTRRIEAWALGEENQLDMDLG